MYSPDGRCLFKYSAYDNALGLKTVAWSPCGQFLGCGSYDQVVRALNHLTFKPVVEFSHPFAVKGPSNAVIFKVSPQLLFYSNERVSEFANMVDRYKVLDRKSMCASWTFLSAMPEVKPLDCMGSDISGRIFRGIFILYQFCRVLAVRCYHLNSAFSALLNKDNLKKW